MPYEIAILDERDGKPSIIVEFSVDQHFELFRNIEVKMFPLLSRSSDYYNDADYNIYEVTQLKEEVLQAKLVSPFSVPKINELLNLIELAISRGVGISSISD